MPTWTVGSKDNLKKHEGLMTMKELEQFSGCKIVEKADLQ